MDFRSVQQIAQNVIESSAALDGQLFTGKVTSANPLKIRISEDADGIELEGDDIILTANVVSKKIYIEKHHHTEDASLTDMTATVTSGAGAGGNVGFIPSGAPSDPPPTPGTTLKLNHDHTIHDEVVNGWATEYGHKLPVDKDDERIVITINRSLEVGDSVIMTRVSHGQQFVVLSRYFEVDKQGEEDNS